MADTRAAFASSICLALPLPPSTNRMHVRRRDGQLARHPDVESYYQLVAGTTLGLPKPPPRSLLSLDIEVRVDHWGRRDLDNCLKVLIDALAHALRFDDANVAEITARKRVSPGEEGVLVCVSTRRRDE